MSDALIRKTETLPANVMADRVVGRLREAEKALQHATSIHQTKLVADVASAQQIFAQRQKLGEDVIGYAYKIKTQALGKLGELLQDMPKASGTRGQLINAGPGRGKTGSTKPEPPVSKVATLAEYGIDRKTSAIAQQLAALPQQTRDAIAERETTLSQVRRERKAEEIRKAISLPDAKFRVLYADPPWSYNDKADAGSVQSGGAEMHYPSMTIPQLCEMPIRELCEDNAVLFLWVTSPLLFESAPLIKSWGFAYKASFVWDKVKHNMGHYNSVRHEFLLVCTRGSCTPDVVELFDSVQSIEKTTHSTKPEEFRRIIDTLYPHGKGLELFARRSSDGRWTCWGNQAESAVAS